MAKGTGKYYDGSYGPLPIYNRNDGKITHSKSIRITSEELANWVPKEIHAFLKNKNKPIEYLRFLNEFFKDNFEYLMQNKKINTFIGDNEEIFNDIEVLTK